MDTVEFVTKCQTLSHPLRSRIFLLSHKKSSLSVLGVAEKFDIHPNLARGHLNALVELELLSSRYVKQSIGAPSKVYEAKKNFICLNLPKCPYKDGKSGT